jgi:hypothetical protein
MYYRTRNDVLLWMPVASTVAVYVNNESCSAWAISIEDHTDQAGRGPGVREQVT